MDDEWTYAVAMVNTSQPLEALRQLANFNLQHERARLLAIAWRAGHRNINELAAAARTTRQTVYAGLQVEGIDASDRGGPVIAAPPLPERAEPSLYGELQHAAFAAIAAHAGRSEEGPDVNPHTATIVVEELADLFAPEAGKRTTFQEMGTFRLMDGRLWMNLEFTRSAEMCHWLAWELHRLGAHDDAEIFSYRATQVEAIRHRKFADSDVAAHQDGPHEPSEVLTTSPRHTEKTETTTDPDS